MKGMTDKNKPSHFRCYWTFPFGHIWRQGQQTSYERTCVLCGKYSAKGNYDGGWHYDLDVSYSGLILTQSDITASKKHRARAERALEKKKKRLNILEEFFK